MKMPGSVLIRSAAIAIGLLLLISVQAYGNPGECRITDMEIRPETNEVELSVDGFIEYGYFPLSEPNRLVFDFPGATLVYNDGNTLVEEVSQAAFREVRLSQFSTEPPISRMVLVLNEPSTATVNFNPNDNFLIIQVNGPEQNAHTENAGYLFTTEPSGTTDELLESEITVRDPGSQFEISKDETRVTMRFPYLAADNVRAEQLRFPDRLHVRIFTGQILDNERPRFDRMGRGNIWNESVQNWVSFIDRDGRGIVDLTFYLYPNVSFSQGIGSDGVPEIILFPVHGTSPEIIEEPVVEIEIENTAPTETRTIGEEVAEIEVDGFRQETSTDTIESIPAIETLEVIENGSFGVEVAQETGTMVALAGNPILSGPPEINVPIRQNNLLGNGYSSSGDELDLRVGEVVVLRVRDLVRASIGNPVVATINVISTEEILITALAPGNTTLLVWESDDTFTTRAISVLDATAAREDEIAQVIGDNDITVNILMSGESNNSPGVILEGTVDTEEERNRAEQIAALYAGVERVTNLIEVSAPRQVLVKVRVVEVNSRALDEHLSQFSAAARTNDDMFTIGVLTDLLDPENPGGGLFDSRTRPGIVNSDTTEDLVFDPVDIILNELVTNRDANILSEPNVVGLSGHEAHFRVGGEIPYTYQNEQGINVVEFKEFGISLDIMPTVDSQGNIQLVLTPIVRTVDMALAIGGIPGFRTREMTTTVQLREGETLVIGGLIQNEISEVVAEVPLLSSIPIFGELFRSRRFTNDETELVIFLTPYILDSASQSERLIGINPEP